MHIDNAHWQARILEWLPRAALVITQLDVSGGLEWELEQLVKWVLPTRILLVLPPVQREYQIVSQWASKTFRQQFPSKLPESRLLTFQPDWHPLPLNVHNDIYFTMKPVFQQNGYESPVLTIAEAKEKARRLGKQG